MSMITRKREKKTLYTKLFTYFVHFKWRIWMISCNDHQKSPGLGMTEENKSAGTSFLGLKTKTLVSTRDSEIELSSSSVSE